MLTPLVRLLVSQGVTYPQFASALKLSFLRAANAELRSAGKRVSDSAVSLLSGVHRKDVRALTADGKLATRPVDRALSVADEVFTRWVSDPTYLAPDGLPRMLPLRGRGDDEPTFESLAQSVSRDFHSRAILDEMTRLGVAEAAGEFVRLRVERFVPDAGFSETLSYVSRNVYDHLGAVEGNMKAIHAGARSPFLEQSVFADGMSRESVARTARTGAKDLGVRSAPHVRAGDGPHRTRSAGRRRAGDADAVRRVLLRRARFSARRAGRHASLRRGRISHECRCALARGASRSPPSPPVAAAWKPAWAAAAAGRRSDPLAVGVGSVTGFGSIIVNGQRYDETAAEVLVDKRPDRPDPATVAAIRLGTHVELLHRDFVIAQATTSSELIGPVSSLGASDFVALGQTVRVNGDAAHPTTFDGFSALSDLAQGDVVEVHGDRTPSGDILATRIELQPAGLAVVRLAGIASAVNGQLFSIGTLAVDASSATILPAGTAIAAGQRVVAWTDVLYSGGPLVAKIVRIDTRTIGENAVVTVDGVISDFRDASSFRVGGVPVDAGAAALTGGAAGDLANGRSVRVRGPFINAVLNERRRSKSPRPFQKTVQLTGAITDFVDADRAVPHPGRAGPGYGADDLRRRQRGESRHRRAGEGHRTDRRWRRPGDRPSNSCRFRQDRNRWSSDESSRQSARPPATAAGPSASIDRPWTSRRRPPPRTGTAPRPKWQPGDRSASAGRLEDASFIADEVHFLDNPARPPNVEIDGIAGNVQATSLVVNGETVQLISTRPTR